MPGIGYPDKAIRRSDMLTVHGTSGNQRREEVVWVYTIADGRSEKRPLRSGDVVVMAREAAASEAF